MNNNKRMVISIFWVVLGIVLIVLSMTGKIDSSISSGIGGMGGALIAIGAMQTFRHIKYNNDSAYKEKIDTMMQDERFRYIKLKAWAWAGYMTVIILAIASVGFLFFGNELIGRTISFCMCLLLVLYWVSYLIISKKE